MDKNKKLMIFAGIVFLVVILSGIVYIRTVGKTNKTEKDLELANKYLDELEYEQAIAIYEEVLSIDPANKEALVNISEAYNGMAGMNDLIFETALTDYDLALKYAIDAFTYYSEDVDIQENLLLTYMMVGNWCIENNEYNKALEYYMNALELQIDDSLNSIIFEIQIKIEEAELLQQEYEKRLENERLFAPVMDAVEEIACCCSEENTEAVFELMQSEAYIDFLSKVKDMEDYYIMDTTYGKVGIYKIDNSIYGNYMLYYGGYNENIREGEGMWFGYFDGNNYYSQGTWKNDVPDGDNQIKEWNNLLGGSVVYRVIIGKVDHGLWDGDVIWRFEEADEIISFPVTFENGKVVVLRFDNGDPIISEASIEKGKERGELSGDGLKDKEGIVGFSDTYD